MKALSIRRRWIGAILSGARIVEVRAWPARHRGPFYPHASRMEASDWPHALVPRPGRLWAWVRAEAKPLRRPVRVTGQLLVFAVNGE